MSFKLIPTVANDAGNCHAYVYVGVYVFVRLKFQLS